MVWALSRKSPVSAHTGTEIVQLSLPYQTLGLELPCTNRATTKWKHAEFNTVCRKMEKIARFEIFTTLEFGIEVF